MPSLDRALLCGAEVTFFPKHLTHKLLLAWWTWGQSSGKNGSAAKFIHTLCATNMVSTASACCQVEYHLFKLSVCFCFCYQSFAGDSFSCGKHERGYRLEVTSTNPRRDYFHGRFRNILLTSIAVVPIQNHTVVSLGTAEGRVIQVR